MSARLDVVGGAYAEECAFPRRQVFRGSGGRAAALLASFGANVHFTTVTGPQLAQQFEALARKLGYTLVAHRGRDDIWFRYRHPMGQPQIHPHFPSRVDDLPAVSAERALVFGMLEGRPPVHAKRVVYDPQDGARAQPFSANGSSADEIALVMSHSEGIALTGETDPVAIAQKLLKGTGTQAVVVKCGPLGALVCSPDSKGWVQSFPSKRVYKIGSGDAFSAAFAYSWMIEQRPALESGWFASRVAAAYVESALDRFSKDQVSAFRGDALVAMERHRGSEQRLIPDTQIYLAGPFFTTAQQWLIDEVRGALGDMGFRVFSPIHEVGEGPAREVAPADLEALERSGLVFAILDGLDAGTLFEVGYARAHDIPVVAIAEAVDATPLTMVLGSGCEVTNDLATAIYAACWHLMGDV